MQPLLLATFPAPQSEPRDYECNALGARLNASSATTLATGVLLTLCSVVYSAFRAGSNTQTFRWGLARVWHQQGRSLGSAASGWLGLGGWGWGWVGGGGGWWWWWGVCGVGGGGGGSA